MQVYTEANGEWKRYRLPKASHCFDHMWQTEWPRIREVDHERFIMDCHGMFYELSTWAYDNHIWGVRPISTHLWVHGDFCTWRGMLCSARITPARTAAPITWRASRNRACISARPTTSGGLASRPAGAASGGKMRSAAGETSDPYLMTGFDKKVLHLCNGADSAARFVLEVDFLGNGKWMTYDKFRSSARRLLPSRVSRWLQRALGSPAMRK